MDADQSRFPVENEWKPANVIEMAKKGNG